MQRRVARALHRPAIAERRAVDGRAILPDRAERFEQNVKNDRRRQHAVHGLGVQHIVKPAWARAIGAGEQIFARARLRAEPVQQARAPVEAGEWVTLGNLKCIGQLRRIKARQRFGVRAQRIGGVGGKAAPLEQA